MTEAQPGPIEPPHGERSSDPTLNAEWVVAEAMRLTASPGTGRIKFYAGARHAVQSMLAAGWTPPSATGETDEAARLREQLAVMQAHVDETNEHMRRAHGDEQAADLARQQMSSAALRQAHKLQDAVAEAVRGRGEPEPTMTYTEVAKGLLKFVEIGSNVEKRERAKSRAIVVDVPLPGSLADPNYGTDADTESED